MKNIQLPPVLFYQQLVETEAYTTKIHTVLQNATRPTVLKGVGGSGKTSLCQAYYQQFGKEYEHCIWVNFLGQTFNSFLFNQDLLTALEIPAFTKEQTEQQRLEILIAALAKLKGKKLLIIDALDVEITRPERNFLVRLQQAGNCTVLASSRYELQGLGVVKMPVFQLSEAQNIYKVYRYDVEFEDIDATTGKDARFEKETSKTENELITHLGRHPLLLELSAKTIKHDFEVTAESLLQIFAENQLTSIDEEVYVNEVNEEYIFQQHLNIIFTVAKLSDTQQKLLQEISLLPSIPIFYEELKTFIHKEIRSDKELKAQVQQLIKTGWLQQQAKNVQMHRAVQLSIYEQVAYEKESCYHVIKNVSKINNKSFRKNPLNGEKYIRPVTY
ncbi:MAG: AAA family ATPase [Chitinophagales bacterium]